MIPYGRQLIDQSDIDAVTAVLKSDMLTQGPAVEAFEHALAQRFGARHAVAVSSGTAALHAAYAAIGLGAGDAFITSPLTFAATANAGVYLGAEPVFVDIETDTGNIDADLIEKSITDRTRLIVPVHYAGLPADMPAIAAIAARRDIPVIEDASHAAGADMNGTPVGACTHSDITTFSFHPVKHVAAGEGGACLTNDDTLARHMRTFRSHGIVRDGFINESPGPWYHEMQSLGFNYRMSDIHAALGTSQLSKLDDFLARRSRVAAAYDTAFRNNAHFSPAARRTGRTHAWHLYPIRLFDPSRRTAVFNALRKEGLGVQVHYLPVYTHPYYREHGHAGTGCPNAEAFSNSEISLPIHPSMSDGDIETVIGIVRRVTEGSA